MFNIFTNVEGHLEKIRKETIQAKQSLMINEKTIPYNSTELLYSTAHANLR